MASPRFLLDENVPPALRRALVQLAPGIDLLAVGDPGAPARGTLDPDLLLAAEVLGRIVVSLDRRSMKGHLTDHFNAGHHTCGVLLLRNGFPLARYVDEIVLIWGATTGGEWMDVTMYIP